jgi:hypothetical protein
VLQPEDFSCYNGAIFKVSLPEGGEPVPLTLRELKLHPERTQTWLRQRPFSLLFHGPAARALRPSSYEVVWPDEAQRHVLFMQLVMGSGPQGAIYEIIFN